MKKIEELLAEYPKALAPLAEVAIAQLKYPSIVEKAGEFKICHRPWVAPLNYLIMLYPGLKPAALSRYSKQNGIQVPEQYAEILQVMNGAFCFGISLFGVPRSMLGKSKLLDRRVLKCHNLASGVTLWSTGYQVPPEYFHFGSRAFSESERAGYFLVENRRIIAVRKNQKLIGEWSNFADFLSDELKASARLEAKLHPAPS